MRNIKELFPDKVHPFIGGLGNRENDAIAYYHSGIAMENIFIVDTGSVVQQMNDSKTKLTYT